jgi:hypothetical protein
MSKREDIAVFQPYFPIQNNKPAYFKTQNQLEFALKRLKQAGCIEKIKTVGIYCILGHGITLLSFFPTWKCLPVEVLDIVPIREHSDD